MATPPESPDLRIGPNLCQILQREALRYGLSITNEECQAECIPLVVKFWGHPGLARILLRSAETTPDVREQVLLLWRPVVQARRRAVGPQMISLPLDRHKGGEILLTAEQVQQ